MRDTSFRYLEWEALRDPIVVSEIPDHSELPKGPKRIRLSRDMNYKIHGLLRFYEFSKMEKETLPGQFCKTFTIQAYDDQHSSRITLEGCLVRDMSFKFAYSDQKPHQAMLDIEQVKVIPKSDIKATRLTEWCINGPDKLFFSNTTERKTSRVMIRDRKYNNEIIDVIKASAGGSGIGLDFARVKLKDLDFLITKVPKGIGPVWSGNIGVEYNSNLGRIPNPDEREMIRELVSFVFGRQLLLVGHTSYDNNGNISEEYACNPWGECQRTLCLKPDMPPIGITLPVPTARVEDIITQLLPKYSELRASLHLKEALWQYWEYRRTTIGANLTILAAAVETIMNGWFKLPGSKSQGHYIEKDRLYQLLRDDIESIRMKLSGEPYANRIMRKIQTAHEIGVTDRFRFFFEEIGLKLEQNEWNAINARHEYAHGGIVFGQTDWEHLILDAQTYENVFHKIVLKVLGYSGSYIDRSSIPWKNKELA